MWNSQGHYCLVAAVTDWARHYIICLLFASQPLIQLLDSHMLWIPAVLHNDASLSGLLSSKKSVDWKTGLGGSSLHPLPAGRSEWGGKKITISFWVLSYDIVCM